MAGLFDFNYEDPQQVGQAAFGAALLNAGGPSRMPISTGQALAQGIVARQQAAAEAMQNVRRNALLQAQIEHMQAQNARLQMDNKTAGMPSNVRTAMWYSDPNTTDEQRKAFAFTVRNNVQRGPNGELYFVEPTGELRRATDFEKTLVEKQDLSSAGAYGAGLGEAATKPREVTGPNGRPAYATDLAVLMQQGLAGAPRIAPQGFGSSQPAPQIPGRPPMIGQPQQPQFQQPIQRPISTPEIPAGIPPDGFRSVDEMRQFFANASGIPGAAQPVAQAAPQAAPQAGLLQPPSAGANALAIEKEQGIKAADLQNKRNQDFPVAKGAMLSMQSSAERSLQLVKDLESSSGAKWNTGILSNVPVRMVKGTSAFDDETKMQSLRDKGVIETMKNLKNLSATGSTGFGQLSEKEGVRLENAMAALQTGLTGPERQKQLGIMRDALQNIVDVGRQVYQTEYKDQILSDLRKQHLGQ